MNSEAGVTGEWRQQHQEHSQFVLFVTSQYDNYIREEGMGNVWRTEECKQNVSKNTARSYHLEHLYVARRIILKAKDNSALTQRDDDNVSSSATGDRLIQCATTSFERRALLQTYILTYIF